MSAFDPKKYQQIEEKADGLVDKLRNSGFTALILGAAALLILGLILV